MAIPDTASAWPQWMDPTDMVDYVANFRGDTPLLEVGEEIATFTVALLPEAALLGVEIIEGVHEGADRSPLLFETNSKIRLWMHVLEPSREDPVFDGEGVNVGIVFTIVTNANPTRRRQRTFKLNIKQG